jgi:hypothetical protein
MYGSFIMEEPDDRIKKKFPYEHVYTLQTSLSYGYKNFPDLADNTDQHQIIVNGLYRIGENLDIGLQFQYQKNGDGVRELLGDHETRIQFEIMYSVEQLWNKQFDDRDSLLNLEHGYIPQKRATHDPIGFSGASNKKGG